jgi:hypothetical protein
LAMTFGMVAGLAQQLGYWRGVTGKRRIAFGRSTFQKNMVRRQDRKVPSPQTSPAE